MPSAPDPTPRAHPPVPLQRPVVAGLWRVADWDLDGPGLARWIEGCLALGVDTFDLAEVYARGTCHARFGAALAAAPGLRERLAIVTKCDIRLPWDCWPDVRRHHYDTSAAELERAVDAALRDLGTEYLDVLLLHRWDPLLDADEVAAAFAGLRGAGKVRALGVSNFPPSAVELLAARLGQPPITNQVQASVLHLEPFTDGTFDQAQRLRTPPMAWSPLGGGRLFGDEPDALRVRAALGEEAADLGVTVDELAYAFLLRHPSRPRVVTGSGRLERVEAAVRAARLELPRDRWCTLWAAATGAPLP